MNKQRRKALGRVQETLESLHGELEALRDEEEDYYVNMPESIKEGVRGEIAEEALDALENALSCIVDAVDYIEESAGEQ